MAIELEKAAKILNEMGYLGIKSWTYDGYNVTAGEVILLMGSHAIKTAEDYLEGQGCVPALDDEDESKRGVLDIYDENWKPIPCKVIERLTAIGDRARKAKNFNDNEALNAAIDLIAKLRNDASVESSVIPTADEALAIINENDLVGREWELFAISTNPNDDGSDILRHEEFIGTAMYHKAKGVKP
jgi:hypothetical protein